MSTKKFIIDEDTMEMAKELSAKTGRDLEEILESYRHFVTEGYKELIKNVPPEVRAMQRRNRVAADFNWKEEVSNELYKKYIG